MNVRKLGTSGMEITTVGFGAWAVGGGGWAFGWGPQDDDDSIAAIVHAVGKGVQLGRHGRRIRPRPLRGSRRSGPGAHSRLGPAPRVHQVRARLGSAESPHPAKRISAPASLRRDCEASLRRLGVERIDLFQIHWPDDYGVPVEESWGEMSRFVDEGKVGAIGVSNYGVELLERCERVRHVDSLQPPFSLIARDSASDVIPWAAAHGTGVIVYSPMASGILTDSFSRARVAAMAEDDWRRQAGNFNEPALSRNVALRDALRPIAGAPRNDGLGGGRGLGPGLAGRFRRDRGRPVSRAGRRLARRRRRDPHRRRSVGDRGRGRAAGRRIGPRSAGRKPGGSQAEG